MSLDNAQVISNKNQVINKSIYRSEFLAPEAFLGKYDRKIDEYSVGVLMYYLLSNSEFPYKLPL